MRWSSRGKSSDIEDRRGSSVGFGGGGFGRVAPIGLGGVAVLFVLSLLTGQNFLSMLDDSLYITRKDASEKVMKAAIEGMDAAKEGVRLTKKKIDLYKDNPDAISQAEIISDQTTLSIGDQRAHARLRCNWVFIIV